MRLATSLAESLNASLPNLSMYLWIPFWILKCCIVLSVTLCCNWSVAMKATILQDTLQCGSLCVHNYHSQFLCNVVSMVESNSKTSIWLAFQSFFLGQKFLSRGTASVCPIGAQSALMITLTWWSIWQVSSADHRSLDWTFHVPLHRFVLLGVSQHSHWQGYLCFSLPGVFQPLTCHVMLVWLENCTRSIRLVFYEPACPWRKCSIITLKCPLKILVSQSLYTLFWLFLFLHQCNWYLCSKVCCHSGHSHSFSCAGLNRDHATPW